MPILGELMRVSSLPRYLVLAFACSGAAAFWVSAAECESSIEQMVQQQNLGAIATFKRAWERGWSQDWVLNSARPEEIDHFRRGVVLEWARTEGENKVIRLDAFTTDGCMYWAHETYLRSDREFARGDVYISQSGRPKYRALVFVTGPTPEPSEDLNKLFDTSYILYYELEAFADGQVQSVYRSKLNFGIDPRSLEPDRVPTDAALVRGTKWPAIERQLARAKREAK